MPNYPQSRQTNIVVQEMEVELLIYDLQTNKAFCLNQTSAMVWQFCDGTNSIAEIAEKMSRKLKINVSEEFVWLALDGLKKDDLLEKADEFEINFGGLNRRELVRKVGLSSMIALPLIASVVAPSALMAQSGAVACVNPGGAPPNTQVFLSQPGNNCDICLSNLLSRCCSNKTRSPAACQVVSVPIVIPGFPPAPGPVANCNSFCDFP